MRLPKEKLPRAGSEFAGWWIDEEALKKMAKVIKVPRGSSQSSEEHLRTMLYDIEALKKAGKYPGSEHDPDWALNPTTRVIHPTRAGTMLHTTRDDADLSLRDCTHMCGTECIEGRCYDSGCPRYRIACVSPETRAILEKMYGTDEQRIASHTPPPRIVHPVTHQSPIDSFAKGIGNAWDNLIHGKNLWGQPMFGGQTIWQPAPSATPIPQYATPIPLAGFYDDGSGMSWAGPMWAELHGAAEDFDIYTFAPFVWQKLDEVPCGPCKDDSMQFAQANPPENCTSREDAMYWMCLLHNRASLNAGNGLVDCENDPEGRGYISGHRPTPIVGSGWAGYGGGGQQGQQQQQRKRKKGSRQQQQQQQQQQLEQGQMSTGA